MDKLTRKIALSSIAVLLVLMASPSFSDDFDDYEIFANDTNLTGVSGEAAVGSMSDGTVEDSGSDETVEDNSGPPATARFLDPDAPDGGDGSCANPWNNFSDVSMSTSHDLYLKEQTVVDRQHLFSWPGMSSDWATVGSYYGENCKIGTTNPINRPVIQGTMKTVEPDDPNAFPTSYYGALIGIDDDYFRVENIIIRNSGGYGIQVDNGKDGIVGSQIVNVKFDSTYSNAIRFRTVDGGYMKNCEVTDSCRVYTVSGSTGTPADISFSDNVTNFRVANNYLHETYGEGMLLYTYGAYMLIENNEIAGARKTGILVGGPLPPNTNTSHHIIVRNNLIYGISDSTYHRSASGPMSAFYFNDFANIPSYHLHYYNNYAAYHQYAVYFSTGHISKGIEHVYFKNNTFVGHDYFARLSVSNPLVKGPVVFDNNIGAYNTGTDIWSGASRNGVTWDSNLFDTTPTDAEVSGTNYIVAAPGLAKASGWRSNITPGSITRSDFALRSGSAAINQGGPLTQVNGTSGSVTSCVLDHEAIFWPGDTIQIGDDIVTLTEVNDAMVSWSGAIPVENNDDVYWCPGGVCPNRERDIGADEFAGNAQ